MADGKCIDKVMNMYAYQGLEDIYLAMKLFLRGILFSVNGAWIANFFLASAMFMTRQHKSGIWPFHLR